MNATTRPPRSTISKIQIKYSIGPPLDGSIGFTLKRTIPRPINNSIKHFYRIRDAISPIGCYECLYNMMDHCCCWYCENCNDKYCYGCGFHREDFYPS